MRIASGEVFQFQYGPIESVLSTTATEDHAIFQFQYGPIERIAFTERLTTPLSFQFQYGPIESLNPDIIHFHVTNFNSSMVRLRGTTAPGGTGVNFHFNSSMVRLRGLLHCFFTGD